MGFKNSQFHILSQMNKYTLSLNSQLMQVRSDSCKSPAEFSRLIQAVFQIKQEILGVTDSYGKFYDLQYAWQNLKTLSNHKLNIISGKERLESVSFGSRTSERTKMPSIDLRDKCLGVINDLSAFRKLQPGGLRIILTLKEDDDIKNIPFEYYRAKGSPRWLQIWNNKVPVLDCQIGENYNKLFEGINIYLYKFMNDNQELPDPDDIMDNEVKQSMILGSVQELLQEDMISQLEFYKKKTLILEKPDIFIHRYFTGETIDRSELTEKIRHDILKQKEEARFFDFISNSSPKKEIPIFVRKGTNKIERHSAEHPLTIEQEQISNLLLELELKGLITEQDITMYQKQVLNLNSTLLQLIRDYYEEELDQIELSRRLKKMFRDRAYRRS